mmetsp:Transcript_20665/g.44718  ORF Transcript_20665/g.44718 Transcript_20665/m.44718 type:complete len:707 (+) Transcript_20665:147-2267(+)
MAASPPSGRDSSRLGSMTKNGSKAKKSGSSRKPLPLKQRTSSIDPRRDYSSQTWTSLLGLLKTREFFVTVDHFSIWRRHQAWAIEDGGLLREHMTKRYASSMVFMSLLLSTELGVLFNSSTVTSDMRTALREQQFGTIYFYVGCSIMLSVIFSVLSLIAIFTAWSLVSAVNDKNAHCIFRSSIGQYAAELPGRFIVSSIYAFLLWVIMFFFVLTGGGVFSAVILCFTIGLFIHTVAAFSSFGRVIMHTGAMGSQLIFDPEYEINLSPHSLHQNLLIKARANLNNNTSIRRQYRTKIEPIRYSMSEDQLSVHLNERSSVSSFSIDTPTQDNTPSAPISQVRAINGLPPPPQRQANTDPNGHGSPSPLPNNNASPKENGTVSTASSSSPVEGSPRNVTRARSNSAVKFSDGFDTSGNRFDTSPRRHKKTLSASGLPTEQNLGSNKPSTVGTRNVSTGRVDASSPGSFSKPLAVRTRNVSNGRQDGASSGTSSRPHAVVPAPPAARLPPVQVGANGGASNQTSAPMWIQQQPAGSFTNGHAYQQQFGTYHPNASASLNSNLMQSWLTESSSTDTGNNLTSVSHVQQLGPPVRGTLPEYGSHQYQINSGLEVGLRRDSNVSDLDSFAWNYRENSACEEMADEEFDALLDPEPIQNGSGQTHVLEHQHGPSLAGLSINVEEEGQYTNATESGALLRAEQGNNYQSLEYGQP